MAEPEFHSDPWLDARLRNVPLPVNLLARLQEIGSSGNAETQQMDCALREVPVPAGLLDRLRDISSTPRPRFAWDVRERLQWAGRRPAWRELAAAAAMLLAVGLISVAIVSVGLKSVDRMAEKPGQPSGQGSGLAAQDRPADGALADQQPDRFASADDADARPSDDDRSAGRLAQDDRDLRDTDFDDWSDPAEPRLDDLAPRTADLVPGPPPALPKPARHKPSQLQPDYLLGARVVSDALPDLDSVEVHIARGLTPPRVAGYDLLYQLRYGQHPFVDPAAHKELGSVQLPLVTSSAGYRRAWRWLKEGRLPAAGDLRTEEFLAALDYGFPAVAAGKLAIRSTGGPAPLREEGLSLLQVAVQAGPLPHEAHGPTELTIVLDMSTSMRRAERWTGVQAALSRLRETMGPGDRVTLIGYSDGPELLADSLGREDAGRLASALQQAGPPRRAANLAAGVLLACSMLPETSNLPPAASTPVRRLLILSSGRVDSYGQLIERACGRLAELAKAGVGLHVLDLGRDNSLDLAGAGAAAVGNAAATPQNRLAAWAQAGDGRLVRVADPSTLSWNLLEALIGRSPVVAAHTSLRVSFNPAVVASYRLIGHERTTITGPSLAQTDVDLRAGESATGLFEVWLRPGNVSDNVATIEAEWQQPGYGQVQHLKQSVVRNDFARSFSAAAPSLQAAALAALTAETLRGSPYAPASRSLAHVIELASQASPSLQAQPSFRELTDFIRLAEKARTHGAALRRKAAAEKE